MKTVILGGPALATTASASRYYSIIDTATHKQIASIEVNPATRTRTLRIQTPDGGEDITAGIVRLLLAVMDQNHGMPIVANDSHAIMLAYRLSENVDSKNEDIVKGWTSLNYEIELVNEMANTNKGNSVRFEGVNIAGIKAITKASSVTFAITKK